MRKTPLFNRLQYSKKDKILGFLFQRRKLFSSLRWTGNSSGALDRAQSFPGEAGPYGRGTKQLKSCRGRELSLSPWCWHWIANSLLENFRTAYCLLVTQKHGNCSNALLSLTQLFGCWLTAALQRTALVSQADFSQTEIKGLKSNEIKHMKKERTG